MVEEEEAIKSQGKFHVPRTKSAEDKKVLRSLGQYKNVQYFLLVLTLLL